MRRQLWTDGSYEAIPELWCGKGHTTPLATDMTEKHRCFTQRSFKANGYASFGYTLHKDLAEQFIRERTDDGA